MIGTAFARQARQRGEKIVFVDLEHRSEFLRFKLGGNNFEVLHKDTTLRQSCAQSSW